MYTQIEVELTPAQRKALLPFQNEVERVHLAGSYDNDHRLSIIAQVYPDARFMKCRLLSRSQGLRIAKISYEKHVPISTKQIKLKARRALQARI